MTAESENDVSLFQLMANVMVVPKLNCKRIN